MPPFGIPSPHMPARAMMQIQSSAFVTELLYSFIIILACLMIFFGTREIYRLSKYKGLKYFRYAFLFFALSFFFRYAIKAILFLFDVPKIIEFSPILMGPITLFLFVYANSVAVFYLLYSMIWKKFENDNMLYIFHAISLGFGLIINIFPVNVTYLIINAILLIISLFVAITAYKNAKESKKQNNLYIIYFLLSLSIALNIVDILIPNFLQIYQSLVYLSSVSVFMTILYKVLKKTGAN